MPAAMHKKATEFSTSQAKSVFLYGDPNVGKLEILQRMEREYTALVNRDIDLIVNSESKLLMQLVKNDKKDSSVRVFEKACRPQGINVSFCQNAFDNAFTKLSNRLNAIRVDMFRRHQTIFTQSKVLFAMFLQSATKKEMSDAMQSIADHFKKKKEFYLECVGKLSSMTDKTFFDEMLSLKDEYAMASVLFKIPLARKEPVSLDSRLMKFEKSTDTKCSHVLEITNPFEKGRRFTVPVNTSRNGIRRLAQYKKAATVFVSVTKNSKLRVQVGFEKKVNPPKLKHICGVDTGMTDCFFTSDGRSIGTMKKVIDFYKQTVEPSLGNLSSIRNKKRNLLHYIRTHALPKNVRTYLLAKVDRLTQMLNSAKTPCRKDRHYHHLLEQEVRSSVNEYVEHTSKDTLTVIERLDIKEFKQGRKKNGRRSVFARGELQKKLMEQLSWHGLAFMEVEADYSSQTCPVCSNIDSNSRKYKDFTCTCCGHHDDADHNAAVNLMMRATDKEFLALCEKEKYHHDALQKGIKALGTKRNKAWCAENPQKTMNPEASASGHMNCKDL